MTIKKGSTVKFTDGTSDSGVVLNVEKDAGANYYFIERTYTKPFRKYSHWYSADELTPT